MPATITESIYDLELARAVEKINAKKAQTVGIQLPDGLKMYAQEICDELNSKTGACVVIWAGSHFGACDMAMDMDRIGVDLLIAWGHSEWTY
mgnify:CR=1 FL=1